MNSSEPQSTELQGKIIDYLRKSYNAQVIILTGSRSNASHRNDSDWDLLVIGHATQKSDTSVVHGQFLDVEIISPPIKDDFIISSSWGPARHTKILLDDNIGTGEQICQRTSRAYARGPEPLSTTVKAARVTKLTRIRNKIVALATLPPAQFYHVGFFYELCIRYWFELQQQWSLPIAEAIPHLQKVNPVFYTQLEKIVHQSADQEAVANATESIIQKISSFISN